MDFITWFLLLVIVFLIIGWSNSKPLFWAMLAMAIGYAIGKNNQPLKEELLKIKDRIYDGQT